MLLDMMKEHSIFTHGTCMMSPDLSWICNFVVQMRTCGQFCEKELIQNLIKIDIKLKSKHFSTPNKFCYER